jgi:hypothetical protein
MTEQSTVWAVFDSTGSHFIFTENSMGTIRPAYWDVYILRMIEENREKLS